MREIDYSHYFWQDDEVRLRAIQPEDWESSYLGGFERWSSIESMVQKK